MQDPSLPLTWTCDGLWAHRPASPILGSFLAVGSSPPEQREQNCGRPEEGENRCEKHLGPSKLVRVQDSHKAATLERAFRVMGRINKQKTALISHGLLSLLTSSSLNILSRGRVLS